MVYQDPLGALDRRLPIGRQIEEPLVIHEQATAAERRDRALAAMKMSACSATSTTAIRTNCRAVSASAWCWRAP